MKNDYVDMPEQEQRQRGIIRPSVLVENNQLITPKRELEL
jgi:hypothetical protein